MAEMKVVSKGASLVDVKVAMTAVYSAGHWVA